jgi:hypothetical protein
MSAWVVLAINLVLLAVAMFVIKRYVDRKTGQQSALDEIKREVGAIITELNQTTERNIELAEDRMRRIRELVQAADKRLSALRTHEKSSRSSELTYSRIKSQAARNGVAVSVGGAESFDRADAGNQSAEPDDAASSDRTDQDPRTDTVVEHVAVQTHPEGEEIGKEALASADDPAEQVPLRERVKALYLRGLATERIASITGRTVGEIELMISLDEL